MNLFWPEIRLFIFSSKKMKSCLLTPETAIKPKPSLSKLRSVHLAGSLRNESVC